MEKRITLVGMRLYVGNLPYDVMEEDLRESFSPFGEVLSASVISDKFSGRSRGFGFVEMSNPEEGKAAIEALNGADMKGRTLTVNEAQPRPERSSRGGDRGDRGDRGGRGRDERDRSDRGGGRDRW